MTIQVDAYPAKATPTAKMLITNGGAIQAFDAAPAWLDDVGVLVELLVVALAVDEMALPVAEEGASDVRICESSRSEA